MNVVGVAALAALGVACRSGFDGGAAADASSDASSGDAAPPAMCEGKTVHPLDEFGFAVGSTRQESSLLSASCGGGLAPEIVFGLEVDEHVENIFVAASSPPASFPTIVSVRSACGPTGVEIACGSFSSGGAPALFVDAAEPGSYIVVVDGDPGQSGIFELQTVLFDRLDAPCQAGTINRRCGIGYSCGTGNCQLDTCAGARARTGAFAETGSTRAAPSAHAGTCNGGGPIAPEVIYEITLANAVSNLSATTDLPGTNYDTLLYLRSGCQSTEIACNDDIVEGNTKSIINTGPLAAGTYYLFVDGFQRELGDFEISVTLTP